MMLLNEAPLGAAGISPGRKPGVTTRLGTQAPERAAEVVITPEAFFRPDGYVAKENKAPAHARRYWPVAPTALPLATALIKMI